MEKQAPYDYEQFFADLISGRRVNGAYDIDNHACLIEVKSCSVRCLGGRTDRFGRFHIQIDNHVELKLEAVKGNKIPLYGFVVRMSDVKDMCLLKDWDSVEALLDYGRKSNFIQWHKVFGLHSVLVRQM